MTTDAEIKQISDGRKADLVARNLVEVLFAQKQSHISRAVLAYRDGDKERVFIEVSALAAIEDLEVTLRGKILKGQKASEKLNAAN